MSRPSRQLTARLFEPDGYTFKHWLQPFEVEEMHANGFIEPCIHPTIDKQIGWKLRDFGAKPSLAASNSSISLSEMQKNVGEPPAHCDYLSRAMIAAAQAKVNAWPSIWNERATVYAPA